MRCVVYRKYYADRFMPNKYELFILIINDISGFIADNPRYATDFRKSRSAPMQAVTHRTES
jgi:hypothetical protein